MSAAVEFDVFLSHNSKDKKVIKRLARELSKRFELSSWLDEEQIKGGALFQDELERGMNASRTAIVAYGESGIGPWEMEEVRALLTQSVKLGKPVIPILLPEAPDIPDLPVFLSERNWIDLRKGLRKDPLQKLADSIGIAKPVEPTKRRPNSTAPPAKVIPKPPAFHAEPAYLGSHEFVGRRAELETLDDWALPSD